ncbi:MAG: oligosaccharide flippase family protein [Oleiphilaceae bacterium]|nr:oligosaccharide flippase family protein [Oleiphilaceae bacterium]
MLAVAISLLSLPIITRIYDPEAFGNFQILLSTVGLLSVISCFRYEMAIVLPKSRAEANAVYTLALILLALFTFLISVLLFFVGEALLSLLGASVLVPYLHFLIVAIFFSGLVQIARYVLTKEKRFGELGKNRVIESASAQGLKIGLGLASPSFLSLCISQLVGYVLSLYLAMKRRSVKIVWSRQRLLFVLRKYKKFLLFNTPAVFVNTLALQLPIFMIARYFGAEYVAYYVMAVKLIEVPLKILGNAISQVYFKQAADIFNQGEGALLSLYKSTVLKLAIIITLPALGIYFLAEPLVPILLGERWSQTGQVMSLLIVWKFFEFLNYPVSTTLTVLNAQHIDLILKLFLSLGGRFIAMFVFNDTFSELLIAAVIASSTYYIVFNLITFQRLSKQI